MNRPALLLATLLAFVPALLHADEVALMQIRFGKDKVLRPVAIELFEGDAPAHAKNFKELARDNFYKGMAFHRAIPNMLVQVGDPKSKSKDRAEVGTGGPGYTIPAEIRRKHTRGAVAAARLPDKLNPSRMSNGSQFYVALDPLPELDGQYTVFGNVIYGLETLEAISNKPVDSNDYPIDRITVQSIKIVPREQLPPPPGAAPAGATEAKPTRKAWW
jgi:cyclophilin family peptidyl-prolyl cis-trans isomerase